MSLRTAGYHCEACRLTFYLTTQNEPNPNAWKDRNLPCPACGPRPVAPKMLSRLYILGEDCYIDFAHPRPDWWCRFWARFLVGCRWERLK